MLKLLYKPTGNIFTLPDEEALRIKRDDRGNDYKILDCGDLEDVEETITQEEVQDIVEQEQEALEQEQEEFEQAKSDEAELPKVNPNHKKFEIKEDYSNMTKKELAILAEKITGKYVDHTKTTKDKIIAIIEGK